MIDRHVAIKQSTTEMQTPTSYSVSMVGKTADFPLMLVNDSLVIEAHESRFNTHDLRYTDRLNAQVTLYDSDYSYIRGKRENAVW